MPRWVQYYREHRTLEIQSRSGRPSMTSEEEQRIPNYFSSHPITFLRTEEIRPGLPNSSVQWVLRDRLYLISYRLHMNTALEEHENKARIELCKSCIENIELDAWILNLFFWWICLSREWKSGQTQRKDLNTRKSSRNKRSVLRYWKTNNLLSSDNWLCDWFILLWWVNLHWWELFSNTEYSFSRSDRNCPQALYPIKMVLFLIIFGKQENICKENCQILEWRSRQLASSFLWPHSSSLHFKEIFKRRDVQD